MKYNRENDTLYLNPETDLIASHVEEIRDFFTNRLDEHPDATLVSLDVSGVDFVDSLGVNLIVELYRRGTAASKSLEITGAGKNFIKVANFFRLSSIFPVKSAED